MSAVPASRVTPVLTVGLPPPEATPAATLPGATGAARAIAPSPRRVFPLLLSALLHLAPLTLLAMPFAAPEPLAAGEEAMEVEMVIAEEASPAAPLAETPPDAAADAPSPQVAQTAPEKPEERLKPEETEGETIARISEPEVREAQNTAMAMASAAPPPAAEVQHAAASSAYRARLAKHLARFKRFPATARRTETAGQVVVSFTIDRAGRVLSAHIVRPSGILAFDEEAQGMIRRAEPYPPPPATGAESFSFTIPVSYRLRG